MVNYFWSGDATGYLPQEEPTCYALRLATQRTGPWELREGALLNFENKAFARLTSLGRPYWCNLAAPRIGDEPSHDAGNYLLSYLGLEFLETAELDEQERERAHLLMPANHLFDWALLLSNIRPACRQHTFYFQSFFKIPQKRMANQPTPGAVANTLVRNILTKAGLIAGGLSNEQWQQTLDAFDGCCAYTGTPLTGLAPEKEHAVPMNRTLGGLHVFGNVIPATAEANRQKGGLPYDVFLRSRGAKFSSLAHLSDEQREDAIKRIAQFIENSRTDGLLAAHPELLAFYEVQYQNAKKLCATAAQELEELLQRLNVADAPNIDESDDATLYLPSNEQFDLEEQDTNNLPEAYQKIQERGNEMKVGAYARAVFEELFADGRIAAFLPNLTYREDSFQNFKLSFPTLVTQRQIDPIHYYAAPYRHNSTEYYLCSQWYERNRDCLDSWLMETVFGQSI